MTVVSDYSALLYYLDNSSTRWNALAAAGTQAVVTYSFTAGADLGDASADPYGATAYWSFNAVQRSYFRDAAAELEAVSGLRFIEVSGPAMINVFGFSGGHVAGWADVAYATRYSTGQGGLTVRYSDLSPGTYAYQTLLHELGHAAGLHHPHEGGLTLDPALDHQGNTVMTYNWPGSNASDLGLMDVQALQHIYGPSSSFDGWSVTVKADGRVKIVASDRGETILATGGETVILGRGGGDTILGRESADTVRAGGGADTVTGGYGNDRLIGGRGHDVLSGGLDGSAFSGSTAERDVLIGGHGRDTLSGGAGNDVLKGGAGADRLIGGDGSDVMTGGGGGDAFVFVSYDSNETDTITDFGRGADVIDLAGLGVSGFNSLSLIQDGNGTAVSYGGFDLQLTGYTGPLDASDFLFA
ncbi:type I secretion protein [Roseobacteraceae bacterium NS-SX3]